MKGLKRDMRLSYMRVVAMFYVMYVQHYFPVLIGEQMRPFGEVFSFLSVPTFFFISGLLCGINSERYCQSWTRYFIGKIKRIMIPYWIVAIFVIATRIAFNNHSTVMDYVATVSGIQGIVQLKWALPELGHTWFVSIIMVCYLLTPIFLKLCNNGRESNKIRFSILSFVAVIVLFSALNQMTSAVVTTEILLYYLALIFGRNVALHDEGSIDFDNLLIKNINWTRPRICAGGGDSYHRNDGDTWCGQIFF